MQKENAEPTLILKPKAALNFNHSMSFGMKGMKLFTSGTTRTFSTLDSHEFTGTLVVVKRSSFAIYE